MADNKTMVKNLTEGSIVKALLTYAAPLFLANLLQAVYNVVDMVVVGQVEGGIGMAAVSIGGEVLHLMTFLIMGFNSAGQVIISQYVGAKKHDGIVKMIATMFTIVFFIAAAILIICIAIGDAPLRWLNTDEIAFAETHNYYMTCVFGIFFIAGYNVVCAILRGLGDSKRPFIFIVIASVLNIILDIVFVKFMGMGAFGAALATVIGQAVSFITAFAYLYHKRAEFGFDFKLRSFKVYSDVAKPLVRLGIPMAIQSAAVTLSKTILAAWINNSGYEYSALAGIYNKLGIFAGIVSFSFIAAGSANIGQSIGARKYERVPKILMIVSLIMIIVCGGLCVVILLFPTQVFSMFTTDDAIISISGVLIFPIIVNFLGTAARTFGFSLINGSGNSKLNLIIALLDGIVFRIGLSYLLGFTFGLSVKGFWLGDGFAGWVPMFVAFGFLASGKWKSDKLVR
ncbi:MAG: MATE family efflux transporter [Firmicutes bacterium]|nr:MATE family efflux transporter [Bacillota bacterium]